MYAWEGVMYVGKCKWNHRNQLRWPPLSLIRTLNLFALSIKTFCGRLFEDYRTLIVFEMAWWINRPKSMHFAATGHGYFTTFQRDLTKVKFDFQKVESIIVDT